MAEIDPNFCPDCKHHNSYHDKDRGCTMPVEYRRDGVPVDPCRCKESDAYKAKRLQHVMEARYKAFQEANREYTQHTLNMLDKAEEKP